MTEAGPLDVWEFDRASDLPCATRAVLDPRDADRKPRKWDGAQSVPVAHVPRPRLRAKRPAPSRALSSAVEHRLHTAGVAGSRPARPPSSLQCLRFSIGQPHSRFAPPSADEKRESGECCRRIGVGLTKLLLDLVHGMIVLRCGCCWSRRSDQQQQCAEQHADQFIRLSSGTPRRASAPSGARPAASGLLGAHAVRSSYQWRART